MTAPQIYVVSDPAGELERPGAMSDFQRPDRQRIAYSVRPGIDYNTDWVARDLLRALGKASDNTGRATDFQHRFDQACAWLMGHGTRDIVVASAGLLKHRTLAVLIEAAQCCRARLWLAPAPDPPKVFVQALSDWPHRRTTVDGLRASVIGPNPGSSATVQSTSTVPEAHDTPRDEYPAFVASCRAVVTDPVERGWFERLYSDACEQTARWHHGLPLGMASEETVASFLRQLISTEQTVFGAVTVLRAAQTTLAVAGVGVKVDLRTFLFARDDAPIGLDETTIASLHTYASARYPALACLQRIADLAPATIVALPIRAVDRQRHRLVADDLQVELPPLARPSLYAHLAERLLAGARPDDPLFDARGGAALGLYGYRRTIETVSRETGVSLSGPWNDRTPRSSTRWNQRRGITVFPMEGT